MTDAPLLPSLSLKVAGCSSGLRQAVDAPGTVRHLIHYGQRALAPPFRLGQITIPLRL